MGKILLSPTILGKYFIEVAFKHANVLAEEKGLNKEEVSKDLNEAINSNYELREAFNKYFKDEIKIRLKP